MSKSETKPTEGAEPAAPPNPLIAELVGVFQSLRDSVAAPAGAPRPVAPPPSSETTPGGKFLVNGRWVFSDGSPWQDGAVAPMHQGVGAPGASSLAPPGNFTNPDPFASQVRAAAAQPIPPAPAFNPHAAIPGTSV